MPGPRSFSAMAWSGAITLPRCAQPALLEAIEAAQARAAGGAPTSARYLGQEAGRELVFTATVTPLGAGDGLMVAFEDVTPYEEAGQMRSDFVANVSHELRTPLTALSGFIETLRGPGARRPGGSGIVSWTSWSGRRRG